MPFDAMSPEAEITAVKTHFRAVLQLLRAKRPRGLDPAQREVRRLLLDELEVYAARGVFPQNRHFPGERRPTFIDVDGRHCAVAHLMDLSGESALARSIAERANFASVGELVDDPRVVTWLRAAGFTPEEISLVQPSYCDVARSECVCMHAGMRDASVVVMRRAGWGYEIVEIHQNGANLAVGQRVPLTSPIRDEADGTEVIAQILVPTPAPADGGVEPYVVNRLAILANGLSETCSMWGATSLPLTKADAIKALLSPTPNACTDYLSSLDDAWDDEPNCGALGCDATAPSVSAPASLAILAAVLGAIAARRRRA